MSDVQVKTDSQKPILSDAAMHQLQVLYDLGYTRADLSNGCVLAVSAMISRYHGELLDIEHKSIAFLLDLFHLFRANE